MQTPENENTEKKYFSAEIPDEDGIYVVLRRKNFYKVMTIEEFDQECIKHAEKKEEGEPDGQSS